MTMNRLQRKITLFLGVLAMLTPIGVITPKLFHAGDAWGEWPVETVAQQVGYTPEGMKKTGSMWQAFMPNYSNGKENLRPVVELFWYLFSSLLGVGAIGLVTLGVYAFIQRSKRTA